MANINPLLLPLAPGISLDITSVAQIFFLGLELIAFAMLCRRHRDFWGRPAFFILCFFILLYQFPSVVFSETLRNALPNAKWFIVVINAIPLSILGWLWTAAKFMEKRRQVRTTHLLERSESVQTKVTGALLLMVLGLVGIYFRYVPWSCTGLYAMLFDPMAVLAARELSIKLVSSSVATFSYGVFANAVAPVFVLLSVLSASACVRKGLFVRAALWFCGGVTCLLLVLIPGIKGMLLPSFLVLFVGLISIPRAWATRLLVGAFVGCLAFVTLSAVEVMREKSAGMGREAYDFGYCAKQIQACAPAKSLIESASSREGALGLTDTRLALMKNQLAISCTPTAVPGEAVFRAGHSSSPPMKNGTTVSANTPTPSIPYLQASKPEQDNGRIDIKEFAARNLAYLHSILNRAFVTPLQVGAWHYLSVSEHGSPGIKGISLPRKLIGESVNMPVQVYQQYGVIYSGGDKTSTSTAPTSFLLAYPGYLGFAGLCIAIFCVIGFDFIASLLMNRADKSLRAAAAGLFAVAAMNLMTSDYITAFISHGVGAGIVVIGLLLLMMNVFKKES